MIQRLATAFAFTALTSVSLWANHPVLVEGNCSSAPAGTQPATVAPGTCGDYDGDGRIGTAEDTDGVDRIFGTITAANAAAGADNNGTITIVTSGTFPESITLTGNITLQAAPGVHANIDAVLQGDPGSPARQRVPGIIVNAAANRFVIIRNIHSTNWTSGIQINGSSRVAIEECVIEHNTNFGIEVTGNARVSISETNVIATGYRQSAVGDFPISAAPAPGKGIEFGGNSTGVLFNSSVIGSFGTGVSNMTGSGRAVILRNSNIFDNGLNTEGIVNTGTSSEGGR